MPAHTNDDTPKKRPRPAKRDETLGVQRIESAAQRSSGAPDTARTFAIEAARSLSDDKCEDVLVLDLRGISHVTDYFVIGSGTSERQMKSSGEHVKKLGTEHGMSVHHSNLREGGSRWIIMDLIDVVVHIFDPEERAYYDLEMLWGDAPRVPWKRNGAAKSAPPPPDGDAERPTRNRAGLRNDEKLDH